MSANSIASTSSPVGSMLAGQTSAPSSPDRKVSSPRQTDALLPTDLFPAGQGVDKQEVSGNGQEKGQNVEDIRQTADKANAHMKSVDTHVEFKVSEQTGRIVVSVIDTDTNELIRQIPPESMNKMTQRFTHMRGLILETSG